MTKVRVSADVTQVDLVIVAPFLAAPMQLLMIVWVFVSSSRRRQQGIWDTQMGTQRKKQAEDIKKLEENKKAAKEEFEQLVLKYIKPLLNTEGTVQVEETDGSIKNRNYVLEKGNNIYVYPCKYKTERSDTLSYPPFYCKINKVSTIPSRKFLEAIIKELLKATEYSCYNNRIKRQRSYGTQKNKSDTYKERVLACAFEFGICSWLAGDAKKNALVLHSILCQLIDWAGKTYEGKKVPFGIIIDFDLEEANSVSYMDFLGNNNSAVFTDGIFSGIMLDKRGNLSSFLTRESMPPSIEEGKYVFVPYQFTDFARHCVGNKLGIIVLETGEILIIKGREVCFAKRGGKWIPFSWEKVKESLRPYFVPPKNMKAIEKDEEKDIENKIKEIYATLLDVSFAHTGGCFAIILTEDEAKISAVIKDGFELSKKNRNSKNIDTQKINVLEYLLAAKNNKKRTFFEIERPLRKEILSLDGAVAVSVNGEFHCAGSIISVPGGSTGGGRSAAAKYLAKELGVGIKISEDGYIEAYGKDEKKLFEIK